MGDSFPSQADIDQVLAVCPELDTNDVRRDLKFTKNVELTVNRALDGRFLRGVFDLLDRSEQPTCDSSTDINSDDDDLSNITFTLQPTACTSNLRYASTSRKEISDSDSDSDSEPRFQQNKKHVVPTKKGKASNDALTGNNRYTVKSTAKKGDTSTGKYTFDSPSKSSDYAVVEDDVISVDSKSSPMEKYNTFKRRPHDLSPSGSSSEDDLPTPPRKLQREEAKPSFNTESFGKQASLCKKSAASSVVALSSSDSDSDSDEEKWRMPLSCRLNTSKPAPANDKSSTKGSSSDERSSLTIGKSNTVTPQPRSATVGDSVKDGLSGLTCSSQRSIESDSQGSKNKGKKRSPEEIQERRRQALLKRQEKELERQRKKEEREQLQQEREAKKKMKEMEAAKKRAERETFKNMKPGECLKYITVVLDKHLAESPCGGNILTQLHSSESKFQIVDQLVPYSVSWRRTVTLHNFGEDIQLGSISTNDIEEEETLVYLPVADFVLLVYNYRQQQQGDSCVNQETLQSFVCGVKAVYQGKKVTLIVFGLEKYFRDQSTQRQRQFRDIVRNNGVMTEDSKKGKKKKKMETENSIIVTRIDVEQALVHLQLWEDVVVKLLEEPEQVADMIRMYTKAVAETPFKRQRDESTFSFHIESNAVSCVKVDKDGRGLLKVWQRHIQQMRNVSPEMSAAIVAEYPSPQLLLQAYERCSTEKEAQMLLKDIVVRRGAGVLATSRRIGPEVSKRLHTLLTSSDSEKLLQSTS